VLLKKRYDLIPNLVAVVKGYMQHEAGVLTHITELRAKAVSGALSTDETVAVNSQLDKALRGIMVTVENYPEPEGDREFPDAGALPHEIEEQISAARRAFNPRGGLHNAVEMVPTNLMAGLMGYRRRNCSRRPRPSAQT